MASRTRNRIIPVFLPYRGCRQRCSFCRQDLLSGQGPTIGGPQDLWRELSAALIRCPDNLGLAEVAFYGGDFGGLPEATQREWLAALTPFVGARIIAGLRFSTRPDSLEEKRLPGYRRAGVRTIEIGVQTLNPEALQACRRNYTPQQALAACRQVIRSGISLGVHLMVGLPGDTPAAFAETVTAVAALKPAFVRLHPLIVFEGTGLAERWREGAYRPLTEETLEAWWKGPRQCLQANKIPLARQALYLPPQAQAAVLAGPQKGVRR